MIKFSKISFVLFMMAMAFASCDKVSPPKYGCMNPLALNFDPDATLDDGHCEFDPSLLRGCTDTVASNYDPMAVIDDCHCRYDDSRTVLVEDYTGFRCPNCPRAAEALRELECLYGARIIPLAVHVSQTFASPENNPDGSFSTDFRTSIGNMYDTEFGNSAFLPNGLINRKEFDGALPQLHGNWAGLAAGILAQPAEALVHVNVAYDEGTRNATATVDISALQNMNYAPYRIVVLLSEDSISDWQIDNAATPPRVEGYIHMHVLRDGFTGAWGELLNGGANMAAGYTASPTFNLTLQPEFKAHHCNVVAFIFRDDTKEVIQADYHSVTEH
ncbi:MAG: Omp28-related outer membrane protein [Flavobacteriales bacterium]|nr:Omp28-related outer membrane protein [Flavobacteriales bacterium]